MAFRRAEVISSLTVCNPYACEVLAELLARSRRDAAGRELRALAYRAGLPVYDDGRGKIPVDGQLASLSADS